MWIETSQEVYNAIFKQHKLILFSSFSDITGSGYEFSSGTPELLSEWGFENSDYPFLKNIQTKDHGDSKWNIKYYLFTK